jgi:NhaD family Na+/H+ antiporter
METLIVIVFVVGYLAIAFEHSIDINKAASALVTGVLCWTVYIMGQPDKELVNEGLTHHLGNIASILFFLLGAMTIVELIDAHDGFQIITDLIKTSEKKTLLWIISFLAFFLSAVLDNLTTAIVMVSLCRKLIPDRQDRLFFAGLIVIAANAGGAWSPIGDITTTMLWIGGQITSVEIIKGVFIPSLVCLIVPLLIVSFQLKGKVGSFDTENIPQKRLTSTRKQRKTVFALGVGALVFVPIFKTITHLPPYMGILLGLGILWIVTEFIHKDRDIADRQPFSVGHALQKIDTPSVLFFMGILIAITALESLGTLEHLAQWLTKTIGNDTIIVMTIGLLSAVVDNVPLVAAAQGMYSLDVYPTDHFFWEFLAYCSGTGGSILIIGSAAGVAAMGMERIEFFWYLKRISLLALAGYLAGCIVYVVFH